MIRNYFKIAWRNLTKNKVYSFINIFGLAIGMAVTILIGLWVADELNYNHTIKQGDTIAQVIQTQTFNGRKSTHPAIPRPLEAAMKEEHGDKFKHIVMASWFMPRYLTYKDKNISRDGQAAQVGFEEIFSLNFLKGDPKGLTEKKSIMLSERTAKALFGDEDPIGKILRFNNSDDLQVTAVYEDVPRNNTLFEVDFLVPWEHYADSQEWMREALTSWGNNSFQMFVQIGENQTMEGVSNAIRDVKKNNSEEVHAQHDPEMFLLPMEDWHLRNNFENGVQTGGRIENLWLFATIGLFVLLLACINFMNLSTARSEKRAKEVGIRKTVGSERGQLVRQFLSESLFTVILAFLLAMALVILLLEPFNQLSGKLVAFPWVSWEFWIACTVFILFTAVLAGSYPALYLSSFNPVTVLKGTFKAGRYAAVPRKVLVVIQFTVSIALIIGTLIVMKQVEHGKSRPIGYNNNGLIQIPIMSMDFSGKYDMLRTEFMASGGAINMASSSSAAIGVWSNRSGYTWEGKPEGFQEDFGWIEVSFDYPETMELEITQGRNFSREFASDSMAIIINESAVKYMGFEDPIGQMVRPTGEEEGQPPYKIIGVVKDMLMESPYRPVKQTFFLIDREESLSFYNLRLNPENSVQENLARIEKVYKSHFPNLPFEYDFIDEQFANKFATEERIAKLAGIFTILAIFISCLGLFGLASFVAEQRTKEIGVRKVLGASIGNLWMMLSREFVILVGLSLLIAIPIAWYVMQNWIAKFDYRTSLGWMVFFIAGFGAMFLTLFTVSFQAVRAAASNPVDSLRDE